MKFRNGIYGFLALWILIFHVETRVGMDCFIPLLTPFVQLGNFGVDVFLFLSGFCLCFSLKKDSNTLNFYSKRFKRVVIAYLIISIPFFIWKSIEEISSMRVAHFVYDLSGLSFWFSGCLNAWFVEAILLFYVLTPLFFYIIKKGKLYAAVLILAVYAINLLGHYELTALYEKSAIAWTRLPIFIIGIATAYYYPDFESFKGVKIVTVVCALLAVVLMMIVPHSLSGFRYWLMYAVMVIPAIWVMNMLFEFLPSTITNVFGKIGKVSLEIYLVHIMTLHVFTFYELNSTIGQWMYLLLPSITLPLSFLVSRISSNIITNKKVTKQ